jgi:hypothetical protein
VRPIAVDKISLYPGEGVYSIIDTDYTPTSSPSSPNIRYAGLGNTITTTGPFTEDMLLTFNANTTVYTISGGNITYTDSEEGSLTGVSASILPSASWQQARVVQTSKFTGPYRIDARDLLGRNHERKLPGILVPVRNDNE